MNDRHRGLPARNSQGNGIRLTLLGGFSLELNGDPVPLRPTAQRLAAFLGLRGRVARPVVAGQLWPDTDLTHAQGCLRTALWRMQSMVPDLVCSGDEVIELQPDVWVDVREGEILTSAGPRARSPSCAVELLPGWYDDWVLQEREWFRQLGMRALERLAAQRIADGRCGEALEAALEAVSIEPLRESAHRIVIAVHLAEDNVAEALEHYTLLFRLLDAELGVRPSGLTRAMLRERIPVDRWPAVLR